MHIVIVGNGIAGVTAARHVRKASAEARITMVSGETWEPYSRTALMYVYMGALTQSHTWLYEERFWAENRIDRVQDWARGIDTEAHRLALDDGALDYDRLLIATGSRPALPPWPGVDLPGVQGLYHLADLGRMERDTDGITHAVVVGGGLIGVELAEMLRTRGIDVTFLVREPRYLVKAFSETESALVEAEIRRHGVDLRLGAEVDRVEGDARVSAVVTTEGDTLPAQFVGVGTGVRPNVDWVGAAAEVDRGVLVDRQLATSAPNVWAAGDCAQLREPPTGVLALQPIWYTARMQGATAGLAMAGHPRDYDPGVFFNSAKFFDLEWQVYGACGGPGDDWETSDGRRSLRIRHADGRVQGVNSLGVRMRQEVCTRWISEGWTVDRAIADIGEACFDPEFTRPLAVSG